MVELGVARHRLHVVGWCPSTESRREREREREFLNGGRVRRALLLTPSKSPSSSSPMLLRRACASLVRWGVHSRHLTRTIPVEVARPPGRIQFAVRTESLGCHLMTSSCRIEGARRAPYVPLPPPTADKGELFRGLEAAIGSPFSLEPLSPPPNPLVIVISGPSGVGKDAVIKRLQEVRQDIHFVVTATSREKRPGEVNGKDYYFVTKEEFLSMVERNDLLEYALVYGEYKGIPKQQIRDFMAKGYDIVLRVDIQGAATLRSILGNSAVFIFLVAENEAALVKRLVSRKTETAEMLLVRIATAREEVKHMEDFDYVVVNAEGELENAVKLVESIIDAEKARIHQRKVLI